MATFYHVTSVDHPIGTVLRPGRFGASIRTARVKQTPVSIGELNTLAWESNLEVARRCIAPSAPSRLSCVFGTPTLAEAQDFQRRYRSGQSFIFEIQVANSIAVHVADFESITTTTMGKTFLDTFVDAAMIYWTHFSDKTLREVIIGGDATVVAKV